MHGRRAPQLETDREPTTRCAASVTTTSCATRSPLGRRLRPRPEIEDEDALVTVLGGRRVVRRRARCSTTSSSSSGLGSVSRSWASRAPARRRSRAASPACTLRYTGAIAYRGQPLQPGSRARDAAVTTRDPVRLPEPVQLAQPAEDDRADRRPAAAPLLRMSGRRRGTPPNRGGSRVRPALAHPCSIATRTSSREASASARRSPVR